MDTGQILHNTKYYYEFDSQVELTAVGTTLPILHIWEGYFEFIFGKPIFYEVSWHGFTRDCQHFEGIFDNGEDQVITDLEEYIDDMRYYKDKEFKDADTRGAYELILNWFIAAKELGCKEVLVRLE